MFLSQPHSVQLNGQGIKTAIVCSRFNREITEVLLASCLSELKHLNIDYFEVKEVPGALEIPIALAYLANTTKFSSLIALGCVIRGETYHFELVSEQSATGITQVSLTYKIPIVNAILTTENFDQAKARAQPLGCNAARVAIEMDRLITDLKLC
ncbi:MAG: 6,7-dimethyl-8-ribityllumazine synthase [Gammaproteobacteria bacterium]|nr:6,7-dimethyl-8-ribityllumazine synthase [Gammaproteobacteria bacterium]